MRQAITAIGISFLLLPLAIHQETAPATPDNDVHFNIPSPVPLAYSTTSNSGAAPVDTASLKQGSWYNNAVKNIEESEYQFNWIEESNAYCTPNRHQNLRFFYTEDGFTVEPRTTKVPVGEYDPTKDPDKIKYKELPGWKVQFELDKGQTGNGNWQLNGNTAEYITPAVTVQYINNKEGMRQNFIVQQPLQQQGKLRVNLAIKTTLKIKAQQTQLQFFHKRNNVLNYSDLKVWDACGNSLAASFKKTTKGNYFIEVDDKNATYPVTIDPVSTTPSNVLEPDQAVAAFATSVASAGDVNGDGYSDVIVGAIFYDNGQTNEGAAFVYHGSATGTNTTAATMLENNQANAAIASSVSSAGDVNGDGYSDVIVGAYSVSNGEVSEGVAYVYHGSATGISTTPAIVLENNQANAHMGISVSTAGDVNRDGYSDVIVGAYHYTNNEAFEGAAFVYYGSAVGLTNIGRTILEINQAAALFGCSVACAGDVNDDGYSDVIVGAYAYDNIQIDVGAAFIYQGSATGIGTVPVIIENGQAGSQMGYAVAGAGDVNGDSYSDVIVGAYGYDNGQIDEGAAFIYQGSAAGINTGTPVIVEGGQAAAQFGFTVAGAGDVNGDGYSDVLAGAPQYDNAENNEGAVSLYYGSAAGINTTPTLFESNQAEARMGTSVACAGDVNGDGYSDILAGSPRYTNGEVNEGRLFIFHGAAASASPGDPVYIAGPLPNIFMGFAVSGAGDINGDGYGDVIIGAPLYDNGETDEGALFVYYGSLTGINAIASLTIESGQAGARLGISLSDAGDVNGDGYSDVIAGANLYDNGESNEGVAFIYHGSAAGLVTTTPSIIQSNQADAQLGRAVAGAGDINGDGYSDVIAGSLFYDNGQTDEGAAFIYYGTSSGINTATATILESNQAGAQAGRVAGAGDLNGDGFSDVVVGSALYSNGQANEGAVFIYYGASVGININATIIESNTLGAAMGSAADGAGDVNGDGYGDLLVGASAYPGASGNGAAFLFDGSAAGINTTAAALLQNNNAFSMGAAVAGAGDVNGDGYSDVVIGAPGYSNGEQNEGAAFIYHGSATGLTSTPRIIESDAAFRFFGNAVSGAGDVNGDGYNDLVIGSILPSFSERPGFTEALPGFGAYVFNGNGPDPGKRNNLLLYNTDLITLMQQSNLTDPSLFGAGLHAKSFLGRQDGKLVWETVGNGNPFSGNPITNSTSSTAQQSTFTDLGLTGTALRNQVSKVIPARSTYVRARIKYDPATALTGQVYGPWHYPEGFLRGRRDLGAVAYFGSLTLPVKFISFTVVKQNQDALLRWITADETPGARYQIQHSTDGTHFTTLGVVAGYNGTRNEYEWLHTNPAKGRNYYRIVAVEDEKLTYTAIRQVTFNSEQLITVYPNPVKSGGILTIEFSGSLPLGKIMGQLIDMGGKKLMQSTVTGNGSVITITLPHLPAGQYVLRLMNDKKELTTSKIMITE